MNFWILKRLCCSIISSLFSQDSFSLVFPINILSLQSHYVPLLSQFPKRPPPQLYLNLKAAVFLPGPPAALDFQRVLFLLAVLVAHQLGPFDSLKKHLDFQLFLLAVPAVHQLGSTHSLRKQKPIPPSCNQLDIRLTLTDFPKEMNTNPA